MSASSVDLTNDVAKEKAADDVITGAGPDEEPPRVPSFHELDWEGKYK